MAVPSATLAASASPGSQSQIDGDDGDGGGGGGALMVVVIIILVGIGGFFGKQNMDKLRALSQSQEAKIAQLENQLGSADAGDYEAPTLEVAEAAANPVATFENEPAEPPPVDSG